MDSSLSQRGRRALPRDGRAAGRMSGVHCLTGMCAVMAGGTVVVGTGELRTIARAVLYSEYENRQMPLGDLRLYR